MWKLKTVFFYIFVLAISMPLKNQAQQAGSENTFVVYFPTDDIGDFEDITRQVSRLKPFGRIDIDINNAAEKAFFELPPEGGNWHDYASYNRSVAVFFPDEKIAPFIPESFVKNNRKLLEKKLEVIRKLGLSAAFRSNEPRYLPEAFFKEYPHLMGPRVDHPRRSTRKEFAPCFHQQETVDMYQNMVNQLFAFAPEINTFYFSMNDAGSGTCWADWLYTGPNGPSRCRDIPLSESVVAMLNVYREGARQTGHDIDIFFHGMFTDEERDEILKALPENCYLRERNYPPVKSVSGMGWSVYPVNGIVNPLEIIRSLNRDGIHDGQRYNLSFQLTYGRGHERLENVEKLVDIVEEQLKLPAGEGDENSEEALRKLCVQWGGENNSRQLFEAFVAMNEAFDFKNKNLGALSPLYWGVSTRHITRPLVFAPNRLAPNEEDWYLPHVFNISPEEARTDYMDIHGGNKELEEGKVPVLLNMLEKSWSKLEAVKNAPEQEFLESTAMAMRIYASVIRSCNNFYKAQEIRNRNKEALAGKPHRPDKTPTWTGNQDLQDFNAIMRNELDNTLELTELLEAGGMELMCHAKEPLLEDTFILGPDLINQLKKKREVMLAHWTDIEGYLATPFK